MNVDKDYSGQFIGKYQLVEKLGKGHFGAVYCSMDVVLKTEKAVKIMNVSNPTEAQKLFDEASIPYKCTHNNIVKINGGSLETFENQLHFVIDMELIDGGSLDAAIKNGELSVLDTLSIFKSVLFGLQHSHNHGIVHRDIKPANILISQDMAKLSDFGLATALNSILPQEPWYLTHAAPEIADTLTATVETDIYAVGMTMFRAVNSIDDWLPYLNSLKNPQRMLASGELATKAMYKPYIPTKVKAIIKKACKPDPTDRYHSASEMRDAIEKLRPLINWHKISESEWQGISDKQTQFALISQKRKMWEVQVKINGRKSSTLSKTFNSYSEASAYLYTHISKTTLV